LSRRCGKTPGCDLVLAIEQRIRDDFTVVATALRDESDAGAVVRGLQGQAVPVEQVLATRELVLAAPGLYAWWSQRGAIAGVPHVPRRAAAVPARQRGRRGRE
jgi:hypothetical protein